MNHFVDPLDNSLVVPDPVIVGLGGTRSRLESNR